jgi:hypothetical protein
MAPKKATRKPGRPKAETARGRPFSIRLMKSEEQSIRDAVPPGENLSGWIRRILLREAGRNGGA